MPMLLLLLSLCCGEIRAAFFVDHGGYLHPSPRRNILPRSQHRRHLSSSSPPPCLVAPSLLSATSNADSEISTRTKSRKEMALKLIEENSIPATNNDGHPKNESSDARHPLNSYDEDDKTPLESEFINLMSTFLTYSEGDIQSLTSTSTRYLHCEHRGARNGVHATKTERPRKRSKEEGIRYRALYSGVQAASLEPEVLRSFTVLFEDYLPIRLAGRRIYGHLKNLMEEVREERRGEIARARQVCPSWDQGGDAGEDIIEYARRVWDVIVDEVSLLENASESAVESKHSREGGFVSLSQMVHLRIDQVMMDDGIVKDEEQLESIVRQIVLRGGVEIEIHRNLEKELDVDQGQEGKNDLEMTFPIFMEVLYQCTIQNKIQNINSLNIVQNIEQRVLDQHVGSYNDQDTSTMLAAKAVGSGSRDTCKKRQKHSSSFDGYVSKFQLWERKFLGNGSVDVERRQSRRLEILRGCFFGARNPKVVAALKIVYMDYAALRLAGDLIFKLMSKIAN